MVPVIAVRRAVTARALFALLGAGLLASPIHGAQAAGPAWTTNHLDPGRTGNDTTDAGLGQSVRPSWTSPTLDGRTYGEPLVLNNAVYVVTQMNTLYALDAASGSTLWSLSLGLTPVPLGEVRSAAAISNGCGNIDPLGVTGTPVIDPARGAAGTLFALAETWDGATTASIEHQLVAVDLATHGVSRHNADPPGVGFDSGSTRALEQERGALALAGGNVVVPYGGLYGDCGAYHGFLVSLPENLSAVAGTFEVNAPTAGVNANNIGGGIWATGGPAVDASGNVYVTTGNGSEPSNSTYEYTDGVVKLNSSMAVQDFFGPTSWRTDDSNDQDLGSNGPLLIPRTGNPLVFATGKQNTGFLLDSAALSSTPTTHIGGELFSAAVCDQRSFGANAYSAPFLYVPCREGVRALTVNNLNSSTPTFARTWQGPADAIGPPIVAGNRVWVHGSGLLYGLNATTGAVEVTLQGVSTPYNFGSPSAAGGRLFFASGTTVVAFTGPPPPPPPPGGTSLYGVLLNGSNSGQVEVHALAQSSHYSQFSLHSTTAFAPAVAADWQFFVAGFHGDGQPDLFGVHMRNTGSGQVEVHVLSASSGYQTFILHAATALAAVPVGRFQFALASFAGDRRSNLYAIALNNTGTNTVEVHALSEASNYGAWVIHSASALPPVGDSSTWQFKIGDQSGSGDLIAIVHTATGSGRTEVHALTRASGYHAFSIHAATPLSYTLDSQFAFTLGDHDADGIPDIYAVDMNNTGSGQTEVHVLSGASSYNTWIEHAISGLGPTGLTNWQFSTH
jgi:outer membrane protein assembly factor BamB